MNMYFNPIKTRNMPFQGLLMVSSILTPGTIFLLILGAINLAYPAINLWLALVLNVIPIGFMVTLCFISKPDVQVKELFVSRIYIASPGAKLRLLGMVLFRTKNCLFCISMDHWDSLFRIYSYQTTV